MNAVKVVRKEEKESMKWNSKWIELWIQMQTKSGYVTFNDDKMAMPFLSRYILYFNREFQKFRLNAGHNWLACVWLSHESYQVLDLLRNWFLFVVFPKVPLRFRLFFFFNIIFLFDLESTSRKHNLCYMYQDIVISILLRFEFKWRQFYWKLLTATLTLQANTGLLM